MDYVRCVLLVRILLYLFLLAAIESNIPWRGAISPLRSLLSNSQQETPKDHEDDDAVSRQEDEAARLLAGEPDGNQFNLVVSKLVKSYSLCRPAVTGVSLLLKRGECVGVLGANGAGKSSTLRTLAGECAPDSGSVWACGRRAGWLRTAYRHKLGYKPQASIDVPLTPSQALTTIARLRKLGSHDAAKLVETLLDILGAREFEHRRITELSGGTRHKIALAMSLIGSPELLVLDEPTTGVDLAGRNAIWRLLKRMQTETGCTILLSSHSLAECEAVCDRVAVMAGGRLKALGATSELRRRTTQGCQVRIHSKQADLTDPFNDQVQRLERRLRKRLGLLTTRQRITPTSATLTCERKQVARSSILALLVQLTKDQAGLEFEFSDVTLESWLAALARPPV